jgi:hypothetical protein
MRALLDASPAIEYRSLAEYLSRNTLNSP